MFFKPPWPQRKGGLKKVRLNQTRELDCKTMSVVEIFNLMENETEEQLKQRIDLIKEKFLLFFNLFSGWDSI